MRVLQQGLQQVYLHLWYVFEGAIYRVETEYAPICILISFVDESAVASCPNQLIGPMPNMFKMSKKHDDGEHANVESLAPGCLCSPDYNAVMMEHSPQIEGTKSSRLSPGFVHYTALGTD